jgi:hypothetical protein
MKGQKPLPPFGLDMPFDEALRRFIGTDPEELAENVATAKKRREPPEQPPPKEVDDKPPKRRTKPLG